MKQYTWMSDWSRLRLPKHAGYVAAFLLGLVVRAVPEAIAYPAVIGFNTVAYYAPAIRFFGFGDVMKLFYPPHFSPLVYVLMIPFAHVMHPYAVLAAFSSLLYGLLISTVYHFLKTDGFTCESCVAWVVVRCRTVSCTQALLGHAL